MPDMTYDHPEYLVAKGHSITTTAGNGTVGGRFVAYTDTILKSAQVVAVTAGTTAGHTLTFRVISGNGTTTTSVGSVTLSTSSANTSTNVSLGNAAMTKGDVLTITNGTDATGVAAVSVEYRTRPTAAVT